eukprot:scaffold187257_cov35-Tisochrysis_lutea.AAC.1
MAILMQKGIGALPSTARDFAGGFGCIGIVLPLLEELGPPTLVAWLPSGVSIGIGMYVTADWTIPRLVGAMGEMMWRRTDPDGHREHMLMVASGFVLGEGRRTSQKYNEAVHVQIDHMQSFAFPSPLSIMVTAIVIVSPLLTAEQQCYLASSIKVPNA